MNNKECAFTSSTEQLHERKPFFVAPPSGLSDPPPSKTGKSGPGMDTCDYIERAYVHRPEPFDQEGDDPRWDQRQR